MNAVSRRAGNVSRYRLTASGKWINPLKKCRFSLKIKSWFRLDSGEYNLIDCSDTVRQKPTLFLFMGSGEKSFSGSF